MQIVKRTTGNRMPRNATYVRHFQLHEHFGSSRGIVRRDAGRADRPQLDTPFNSLRRHAHPTEGDVPPKSSSDYVSFGGSRSPRPASISSWQPSASAAVHGTAAITSVDRRHPRRRGPSVLRHRIDHSISTPRPKDVARRHRCWHLVQNDSCRQRLNTLRDPQLPEWHLSQSDGPNSRLRRSAIRIYLLCGRSRASLSSPLLDPTHALQRSHGLELLRAQRIVEALLFRGRQRADRKSPKVGGFSNEFAEHREYSARRRPPLRRLESASVRRIDSSRSSGCTRRKRTNPDLLFAVGYVSESMQ